MDEKMRFHAMFGNAVFREREDGLRELVSADIYGTVVCPGGGCPVCGAEGLNDAKEADNDYCPVNGTHGDPDHTGVCVYCGWVQEEAEQTEAPSTAASRDALLGELE